MKTFEVLLRIICFLSFIMMIIGFFKPSISLFFFNDPKKRTRLFSFLFYFGTTVLSSILVPDSKSSSSNAEKENTSKNKTVEKVEKQEPASPWVYQDTQDQMTNETGRQATTISVNTVYFSAPYSGGSQFYLTVSMLGDQRAIYITVTKGQFCSSYSGPIRVKFDDGEVESYTFESPSDGSSNIIIVDNPKKFIAKLKKSNFVKIDAEFFQEGRQVMMFNTRGLR